MFLEKRAESLFFGRYEQIVINETVKARVVTQGFCQQIVCVESILEVGAQKITAKRSSKGCFVARREVCSDAAFMTLVG